ncbi:hypothetical protein KGA66_07855 [Actinocrinis puniceicyclus]|uniref:Uncharacterized protein n=1 Tax=Actinocrinis puniceicyclus TaxID=977794 RepID=A0A8J7WIM5_9ACTN|nr:hypothetical protein [Actinocrinis puniceicyclus]MBS2962953.1 hypothetical protein [Actinocrinis puniceicyclus]
MRNRRMRKALLFVLYIAVVTPVGLLLRLVRDPMRRKLNARAHTYWIESAPAEH